MKNHTKKSLIDDHLLKKWHLIVAVFLISLSLSVSVQAFTLNVTGVNKDGTTTPVAAYRWLLEEDATYHVTPGNPATNMALDFHRSYMLVVAEGHSVGQASITVPDPTKHYYISVLPDRNPAGLSYTNGGAQVAIGAGTVTVYCNQLPIPTAQISIFVFEDNQPLNNAPDLPEERGLGGFKIILEEPGGRYGQAGGTVMLDAFGNPLGNIVTDANGYANIKNLPPGKYGVIVVPPNAVEDPPGSNNWVSPNWQQTTTIEGTKVIDAWVKANEPPFFQEFGPPGWHVFVGFVRPSIDATALTGGQTISGQVVNLHLSRPPDYDFFNGAPFSHTTPWVGLNDLAVGEGRMVYAQRANSDGTFSIHNVPPGNYQLVVWDDNLDLLIAFHGVTVTATGCNTPGGSCNLGDVPVFQWFTRQEHWVFNDDNGDNVVDPTDGNGIWDQSAGEGGMPEQAINLRWRDGTLYQSFPTDTEGFVPFDEIFPFFSWMVAEVDFLRFKATGVTVVVDAGGPINGADPWTFGGQLNPQDQDGTWGSPIVPYRTETGPVLTQAFQGFLGQTSVMMWGKKAYDPGENGGISGIVYYATTRAEDDPEMAAAEPWEPGIPRVTVNLYDSTGATLLNSTTTDSWDDSLPTGCPGDPADLFYMGGKCYDGMRNWNQVRPGIFDGGYAFTECYVDAGGACVSMVTPGATLAPLPAGQYIVEVVPPAGYKIIKSQDKNVDFGDDYVPSPLLLPPLCVGTDYTVPTELSLFPGVPAPLAGDPLKLCDRKLVILSDGANAAADFFLFTETPIAAHIVGFILDDTANEFDPTSPQFGEKYAPPWLPISIHDWTGREIGRTYSDEFGRYNALVPSTYTMNIGVPSGVSPNMLITCMNSPGTTDSLGNFIPDPYFNPQYSTFCYTFQYMPGATTYLDTPVIPVAAFAGPDQYPLDCEYPDGTPRIKSVSAPANGVGGGPYVPATGQQIVITALADTTGPCAALNEVAVPNPEYGNLGQPKTICRDYGFGTGGTVTIGGVALTGVTWSNTEITGTVAAGTVTDELVVTRTDTNKSSVNSVTVQVGLRQGASVKRVPLDYPTIQAAIDAAGTNDLILVGTGTYDEMVIMWKPVQLQGWGEGSVIRAVKVPTEKLALWRLKVEQLVTSGAVDLLDGQEAIFGGIEPDALFTEEGAGIIVLAKETGPSSFNQNRNRGARTDGFTITGADTGGGIVVNGFADYLEISNNRIVSNNGFYGGGIRIGHPALTVQQGNNLLHQDADNDYVRIHNNYVSRNGGQGGAGGGVSVCTGSDNYEITSNYVCGNFTLGNGGGIGHTGLSENGLIATNTIIFNESFNQGTTVSGGGIFIGGQAPLAALDPLALSPGAGSVKVIGNLIQGNYAAAGDGAGIRLSRVNGEDTTKKENNNYKWYSVDAFNNMIVNNVAALAGGGISLQDSVRVNVIHNTIANNDSTATAGEAFSPGVPDQSNPQPAGIVSRPHSAALSAVLPGTEPNFSSPQLVDNIIWHNRSFYFLIDDTVVPTQYLITPATPQYQDLAVIGGAGSLNPQYCLLTNTAGYGPTNVSGDPQFALGYENGGRGQTVLPGEPTTALQPAVAFDEGGNFIKVRYGPLTVGTSDYHILSGSPAVSSGSMVSGIPELTRDYDDEVRPNGGVDIGADEYWP
ncbi:MAG: hypothetical protein AB1390_01300 [Nitrospirota bacterium]